MSSAKSSDQVLGPWLLLSEIGRGGNATVWEAVSDDFPDPEPVALKVLNTSKAEREPYQRFVREIEFLRRLEDTTGVLPVIAAHLPDKPSAKDKAWLAMPRATLLSEALAEASLATVVSALAVIARTLARLAADGVAHRDIKPDNLYERAGEWLVGDFGLVALPGVSDLTEPNRPLGPVNYRPYEMLANPANADPHAADVYAFGKTLWVLATGQNYPPPGHQRADVRNFSIADLRPHRHAELLDGLIDRATRPDPAARPAMGEIADELGLWLELPTVDSRLDLSAAGARLREALRAELDAQDLLEERRELAFAAVRQLNDLFRPINEELKAAHPRAEVDAMPDEFVRNYLSTTRTSGSPEIAFSHIRRSEIATGPDYHPYAIRVGRGVELTREGDLVIRALIDVSYKTTMGADYTWYSEPLSAPAGSVESFAQLQQITQAVQDRLPEAIEAFIVRIASES
jgi:serine/threonine protein kinase